MYLGEARERVGDVVNAAVTEHRAEVLVEEGEQFRVGVQERNSLGQTGTHDVPARAFEHGRVDVRRDDAQPHARDSARHVEVPQDLQRVGLLAGGAARRPGPRAAPFAPGARGDVGQHLAAYGVEHAPVAEEPRNGDAAGRVEDAPFRRIGFEAGAVGGESVQAEPPAPLLPRTGRLAARIDADLSALWTG